MVLLTPGPCMTSDSVRQAAAMPDMNHRDPAFIEIIRDTRRRLLSVYPETLEGWDCYMLGGSGTAAVEAMITSCVKGGPVLLLDTGYYSGRVRAKLDAHEIPYTVLTVPWAEPISLEQLASALPGHEALITTHHETTLGRLHPLDEIASMARQHGVRVLVDAMSSFGADPISFDELDAVASSANKCLHGLPGLSFVLVQQKLSRQMREFKPRTVYLSLPFYSGESPPLTPPVPILNALNRALIEMGEGGARERGGIYKRRADLIRAGLRQRGFRFAIPVEEMSCTLTTASVPHGWTADHWLAANYEHGFALYGVKGEFRNEWFQVANMGEVRDEHLAAWFGVVDELLKRGS